MDECSKMDNVSGVDCGPSEVSFEVDVDEMNHVDDQDGEIIGQDDAQSPVSTGYGTQDTHPMCLKEEAQEDVQQEGTWIEESVKIRQNVADMLEYVTYQLQNTPPEESVEKLGVNIKQEDSSDGVHIAQLHMPTDHIAFAENEECVIQDEEILPDEGGPFVAWTDQVGATESATCRSEADPLTCQPAFVVEAEGEEEEEEEEAVAVVGPKDNIHAGVLGDNMFTSSADVDVPPCVSQEEIIADCADEDVQEMGVPLPFSGTFNNFKDAEVTVEMNEEEVEVLGAAGPAVKNHDYSDDDSDSSQNNMGYHREPLQQAMYHAMAPLPRNNGGNATVPYSSQAMNNIAYVRGIKREYPMEMQMRGPVRTKAARKITPPSPVKKEVNNRESPPGGSNSTNSNNNNRSLQENLRKQELDETFFTCDFCFKLFRRRNALMAHIKLHEALNIGNHNGHVYECKQCNKTYSSRYNLNHHTKRCHGEREHKCGKCNEAYATQSDLSRHARSHGVRSYKCNRCGKVFQKRKTFSAHTKVHPQVIYECITCFQKFSWEEELVDHNKIHQVPDGAPVTALTVKSEPLVSTTAASADETVADSKAQGKHSNSLKLEYCYSYINRVKTEFANQPQAYQDFLNTIKQFKFKSIDINQFLEQIAGIFQDHPTLIDGFNIFLPDECKVEVPEAPQKEVVAVHDPLLDRQYNPRGELDDSLAYLGQVKARFSDKPMIYNTFTYIIKEYKLNSLQIPEVAARVTSLFKDHPDLILGFNTFLPSNNRISVPCYDSQLEGNDVKSHPTESSKKQTSHGNRRDVHDDSKTLGDQFGRPKNALSNGHSLAASNHNKNTTSGLVNADERANVARRSSTNHNTSAKPRIVGPPPETKVDAERGTVEKLVTPTDTVVETKSTSETKASHKESNSRKDVVLENGKPSVTETDSHRYDCEVAPVGTVVKDVTSEVGSRRNVSTDTAVVASDVGTHEDVAKESPQGTPGVNASGDMSSNHQGKIQLPNEREYEAVSTNEEEVATDNEVNSLTGMDTFTNIITVSPSDPSNALPDIERTVALTNPKFPKVSVISAVATGTQHKTTKYGGKGIAFTTVNVKPSAIPKTLDVSKNSICHQKHSPTKIVPLKNSLLYQQLISQNSSRGHSNPSLATFTKIDSPSLNEKKRVFCPESNSAAGDNSSTKVNTLPTVRNPTFKSGIKISVPYIVNTPNSNVIFTLANTMVDDSSKVHGSADNPNLITSTGTNGVEQSLNCKTVYAVPGGNTPTSSANVALISTNTLQNASSTNSYTGLNIVTSTNIAPSTYTLANTKSIASFPTAVPSGNGANKQMLLIRTNPPSNTFFIANSGSRLLSNDNTLRPGCLVPMTKTASSNVNSGHISCEVSSPNSNVNEGANKMLALTTKKLTTLTNNRVGKPNFLAGQKIAIVKTSISDKSMSNAKTAGTPTISGVTPDAITTTNIVNITGTRRYITNTVGNNTNTSPKKRKLAPNRIATVANISVKKKTDSVIRSHTYRNRPLLPASNNKGQPFVVSFIPNAVGDARGENVSESSVPVSSTSVSTDQSNSQVVRTYERSVGSKLEETVVLDQLGPVCNDIQNTQIVKTKAARKQCLIVKTVSIGDDLKPSGLEHNGTLGSEICPKTYSRRDSLTKRIVETHLTDVDLS